MSFNFFVKSNITFGRGAVEKLPEIIAGYGLKNIMVVYDRGVKGSGNCRTCDGAGKESRSKSSCV